MEFQLAALISMLWQLESICFRQGTEEKQPRQSASFILENVGRFQISEKVVKSIDSG